MIFSQNKFRDVSLQWSARCHFAKTEVKGQVHLLNLLIGIVHGGSEHEGHCSWLWFGFSSLNKIEQCILRGPKASICSSVVWGRPLPPLHFYSLIYRQTLDHNLNPSFTSCTPNKHPQPPFCTHTQLPHPQHSAEYLIHFLHRCRCHGNTKFPIWVTKEGMEQRGSRKRGWE